MGLVKIDHSKKLLLLSMIYTGSENTILILLPQITMKICIPKRAQVHNSTLYSIPQGREER